MIEFLKYIKGYLRIRVWGFSPERFMNLCSNKGILLWDIVRDGDVYYMCINLKGFWTLRPIVRKTGTRVAVLERYGLPFFLPKLLKRKVFVCGLFLAVGFWIWSSLYVWNIELTGNYQITQDMFDTFLEERHVIVGMSKKELDIEALEKEIRRQFPEVTWASAKLTGTKLQIDIKENDTLMTIEKEEVSQGMDLVSQYSGTVISIIVRRGVPKVSIGDTVEVGTVLVEGKIPIYNDDTTIREYRFVDADADIVLEHATDYSDRLPFDYVKKEYTGREDGNHYLRIGNREWRLPQDRPFLIYDSVIKETRPLLFEKLSIPVYLGSITYREYQNVEYKYTLQEAQDILNEKIIVFLTSLEEKGVQIIEKNVKIDIDSGGWIVNGEFLVHEPVGKSAATVRPESGDLETNEQ